MKITQALLWVDWQALLQPEALHSIEKILRGTYLAMGVTPQPELIRINAHDLVNEGHTPDEVLGACRAWRMAHVPEHKTRKPPLAGDLHNLLRPKAQIADLADVGMQRLMGAMIRYGYMQGEGAAKYLGETIWEVVSRLGGWTHLCASTPEGCTTTKAQIKKSLESAFREQESVEFASKRLNRRTQSHLHLAKETSTARKQPMRSLHDILDRFEVAQ